jgi:IS5 family transposase
VIIINNSSALLDFNEPLVELDTKTVEIYEKTQIFMEKYPEIRLALEGDLDKYAFARKAERRADKAYAEAKIVERGEVLFDPATYGTSDAAFELKPGRPRMPVDLVFFFMIARGLWGSVSDQEAVERIADSISVRAILSRHGRAVPGVNTIRENLNKISAATRQLILRCQARYILENRLDDFNEVYIDSTHVEANTSFPTDIDILLKLLDRAFRSTQFLTTFGLDVVIERWTLTRLDKARQHLKFVNMNAGKGLKGKVKEAFRAVLSLAERTLVDLEAARDRLTDAWEAADLKPEKRLALDVLWDKIEQDLEDAAYVRHYAISRLEKNVKIPTKEMILSVSDRDAAYIKKGQREPVIGYRPQIARSRGGFICACLTPRGNAADSGMLVPTVERLVATTGLVPELVSVDDGYASAEGVKRLVEEIGVLRVSVSGAKGKKLIDDDLWESIPYIVARTQRSAAESGIFTLKFNHGFGAALRRGLDAVDAELMEKVIAYNFIHIIRAEKRTQREMIAATRGRQIPNAA